MDSCLNKLIILGDATKLSNWMQKQAHRQLITIIKKHKLASCGRNLDLSGLHILAQFIKDIKGTDYQKAVDEIVEFYINAGHNVNQIAPDLKPTKRCRIGFTPLLLAIERRNPCMVKALIKAGADVNQADNCGYTPLHWAAFTSNNVEIVQNLVHAGADMTKCIGKIVHPVLHVAVDEGRVDVVLFLLESGVDVNTKSTYAVIKEEEWATLNSRYDCGDMARFRTDKEITAVGRAVRMRKIDVLKVLLKRENIQVSLDELHFCILEGDTRVACIIIECMEKSVLLQDRIANNWALHCLGDRAYDLVNKEDLTEETMKLISVYVSYGWDINCVSNFPLDKWYQSTLLIRAIRHKNNKLVDHLLRIGASVTAGVTSRYEDSTSITGPVQASIYFKNFVALSLLIDSGVVDLNQQFGPFVSQLTPSVSMLIKNLSILDLQSSSLQPSYFQPFDLDTLLSSENICKNENTSIWKLIQSSLLRQNPTILQELLVSLSDINEGEPKYGGILPAKIFFQANITPEELKISLSSCNETIVCYLTKKLFDSGYSFKDLTIISDEIPALQAFVSLRMRKQLAGKTVDWEKVSEIVYCFTVRGYDLNAYTYHEHFPDSLTLLAIKIFLAPNEVKYAQRKALFTRVYSTPGINWNIQSGSPGNLVIPLLWIFMSSESMDCHIHCEPFDEDMDDYNCAVGRQLRTAMVLLKQGANALDLNLNLALQKFNCMYIHTNALKRLWWAGASIQGIVPTLEEKIDSGNLTNIKSLMCLMDWVEKQEKEPPSLFKLCTLAVRSQLKYKNVKDTLLQIGLPPATVIAVCEFVLLK